MVVDALMVETQTGSASSTMAPPPKQRATKDQKPLKQGIGHQLARSQTQKPETCLHPEDQLRMRGNQAKHWWVCLSCGSRWERTEAAVAVAGQGAVPEQVRPVYRATAPPKLLPPPRRGTGNELGYTISRGDVEIGGRAQPGRGDSPEVPPVVTLIQDGDLQDTGPYGGRALSFHYAWDFRQRHDRNRAVEAIKECCPAFMTGFVTGCSRDTFVAAAREQETTGRLYALVCVPKVTQGLLYQLPTATAVRMAIHEEGPGLNLIVNDKTLVRIFESVVWKGPWTNKDPEDLDLCVRTFLHCLCYPRFCDGLQLPQVPSIQANAQQHRAAFEGLLLAVRTQTAASFLASVALSLPGGGDGDPEDGATSHATSHRNFPQVRVDPMDMDQHDEAVREVHGSLQPVTENEKVVEAMERMDDFRKHDETGRFSLHPHLRRELFKVHRNLNHPAKDVFLRALRHSGVREDVLQWVKEFFLCPLCEASKRSLPARPAHLAKALEFNAIVATDLFYMNLFGTEQIFLVCIDYGTGFLVHQATRLRSPITVRQNLSKFWIAPFGVPELLICDQGPEFSGEQFVEFMSQMGTAIHFTDGASPWKNGRAERAVGTVKQKIKTVLQETSATAEELDMVLAQVVSAHNSLFDRHGYSPNQRLFGRSLRLPGSLSP
eukprot:s3255_g7.t1